jgi:hypothetical protein
VLAEKRKVSHLYSRAGTNARSLTRFEMTIHLGSTIKVKTIQADGPCKKVNTGRGFTHLEMSKDKASGSKA